MMGQGPRWARPCGAGAELLWGNPRLHPPHTTRENVSSHTFNIGEGQRPFGEFQQQGWSLPESARDGHEKGVPGMAIAGAGVAETAIAGRDRDSHS